MGGLMMALRSLRLLLFLALLAGDDLDFLGRITVGFDDDHLALLNAGELGRLGLAVLRLADDLLDLGLRRDLEDLRRSLGRRRCSVGFLLLAGLHLDGKGARFLVLVLL